MHDTLQALLGLQDIDRHIFVVERELRRLPAERDVRRAKIDRQIARVQELQQEARGLQTRVKEIDDMTRTQRQRIRKLEGEAQGARDMALQVAFQHEIKSRKRDISIAEEEGLGLVERVEAIETEANAMKATVEEEETIYAEFNGNVEREMAEAQARLDQMTSDRESRKSSELPHEALNLYSKLLVAREGEAMAELQGRMCQSCFMEIPQNLAVRLRRGAELVQCPSCDRILHTRS
jgi:hypothetical protein